MPWCRDGGSPMTVKLTWRSGRGLAVGDEIRLRLERFVLIDQRDGFRLDLS